MMNEGGVVTARKEPLLPRWLKIGLIFLGVFLFLAMGAWRLLDLTTGQDLNAALAEIEALGWPLFLDELYPEPIPDEENAAVLYQQAFGPLVWRGDETRGLDSLQAWAGLSEEEQATVRDGLKKNAGSLTLLHQGTQLEKCQFDLRYRDGYAMVLPHLVEIRNAEYVLRAAALVALADGRTDQALEHWLDSIAMARHAGGEKMLISELVRIACLSISTDALEAMVQSGQLTDGQLAQAALALEDLNLRTGLADSLKGELALVRDIFTGSFADLEAMRRYSGPSDPLQLLFRLYSSPFTRPWRQHDQATYLMLLKEGIELAEQPYADVAKQHGAWERDLEETPRWQAPLTARLLPALTRASQAGARGEARRDLARTALALERYRLKHGRYPEALTDLVPNILPEVLLDPFDGQPVRYMNDGARLAVYSTGENLQDDLGTEDPQRPYEGDIVFTLTPPPEAADEEVGGE